MASVENPKGTDYNKDGVTDQYDDTLARQDKNKDGSVTPKEKAAYEKDQNTITTETVTDPTTGKVTSKQTNKAAVVEPTISASGQGYSDAFLRAHPDVAEAIRLAAQYKWELPQFIRYVENNTEFGKSRTSAEEAFDIQSLSDKAEDLNRQVTEKEDELRQEAIAAGIPLTDSQIKDFAKKSIRSGLSTSDTLAFLSSSYKPASQTGATPTGQVSKMITDFQNMARSFGITMTPEYLESQVREGLKQGANWQSWFDGKQMTFREQAKNLYPTIATQLDRYSLTDIMSPYMNDASELLGVRLENMNPTDPTWLTALSGQNGPMSRDEWIRVIKTDPKYGWDRTIRARQEYSSLADDLRAAFGRA